jgi:hypothetical protein
MQYLSKSYGDKKFCSIVIEIKIEIKQYHDSHTYSTGQFKVQAYNHIQEIKAYS